MDRKEVNLESCSESSDCFPVKLFHLTCCQEQGWSKGKCIPLFWQALTVLSAGFLLVVSDVKVFHWVKSVCLFLAKRIRGYGCSGVNSELLLLNDIKSCSSPQDVLLHIQYVLWWQINLSNYTIHYSRLKGGQSWNVTFHDTKLSWSKSFFFLVIFWFSVIMASCFTRVSAFPMFFPSCSSAPAPPTRTWSSSSLPRCHRFSIISLKL